jgi:CRISPR/Cas system-associated exonuclease Cas4 (RecB family)
MTKRRKSWSNSTLGLYEQCPHKYMYSKIAKIPEPVSYALTKGLAAHSIAENYLLGKIDEIPMVLNKFAKEFNKLRELKAIPEESLSFNDKWEFIPDGWSHPETWLRMKLDARVDNFLVDFKTGKHYDEHKHQARLYANAHMLRTSDKETTVEFWYLVSGEVKTYEFDSSTLEEDKRHWQERVDTMMNDTTFEPKKNDWCKYCHVKHLCKIGREL